MSVFVLYMRLYPNLPNASALLLFEVVLLSSVVLVSWWLSSGSGSLRAMGPSLPASSWFNWLIPSSNRLKHAIVSKIGRKETKRETIIETCHFQIKDIDPLFLRATMWNQQICHLGKLPLYSAHCLFMQVCILHDWLMWNTMRGKNMFMIDR